MNRKTVVYIFAVIGMAVGGLVPRLWGDDLLSGWSMVLAFVGGMVGVWLGVKVGNALG